MNSMMTLKIFAEGVTQQIKDYLPEEYQNMECKVTEQKKNNGVVLTGILFKMPGEKTAPIVYMEPFYDQVRKGEPADQIMNHIADTCRQALTAKKLPENWNFTNYDSAKDYLSVQVINTKANWQMLAEVMHKEMEDLSVICRLEIPLTTEEGIGSVKVTHELISQWGVRPEEIFQKAIENAVKNQPPVLESMSSLTTEMMGLPIENKNLFQLKEGEEFPEDHMYVLSNQMKLNGASVLSYPNIQEQLESVFPHGCYLLPSSIHEIIIVSKDCGVTPEEIGKMVRKINMTQVAEDEVLSDRIYEFDKEKRKLREVPESIEKEERE